MTEIEKILKQYRLKVIHVRLLSEFREQSWPYSEALVSVYQKTRGLPLSGNFDDLVAAMEDCVKAGLLAYVTKGDVERQRNDLSDVRIPSCVDIISSEFDLDLTQKGYFLDKAVIQASGWKYPEVALRYPLENPRIFEIYARRKKVLIEYVKEFIDPHGPSEVFKIGKWRFSRFEVLRDGYFCQQVGPGMARAPELRGIV